uniref:Receptor-like kinase n=1 Tax=Haemonchus placei TaxID=6290 RepID=A0A0N4X6X1_HAEPC
LDSHSPRDRRNRIKEFRAADAFRRLWSTRTFWCRGTGRFPGICRTSLFDAVGPLAWPDMFAGGDISLGNTGGGGGGGTIRLGGGGGINGAPKFGKGCTGIGVAQFIGYIQLIWEGRWWEGI